MSIETIAPWWLWLGFGAFVAGMLALDLGVFNRKARTVSVKEAAIWSGVWIALSLAFNVFVWAKWGPDRAQEFLTGYVIEKSLSVDNLFVFYTIFAAFKVRPEYQHRLLFWGIIGAVVLRGLMVVGGTALLERFDWIVFVFGAVLIAGGVRMLRRGTSAKYERPDQTLAFRIASKVLPTTDRTDDARLFTRRDGGFKFTPLFPVLIVIELTDVMFATDSILAIFAITRDPFIVLTSNVFAVLGMRALYFTLAGVARRFEYLQPGLALVLIFVGAKLAASDVLHVPVLLSLAVIALLIGGSIAASIVKRRRAAQRHESTPRSKGSPASPGDRPGRQPA